MSELENNRALFRRLRNERDRFSAELVIMSEKYNSYSEANSQLREALTGAKEALDNLAKGHILNMEWMAAIMTMINTALATENQNDENN